MFLLPIGVTAFSQQCTLSIDFHPFFFMTKHPLNCLMAKSLIIVLLEFLAVCVFLLLWLITSLNLILKPSNVFSWVILLLLRGINYLIYILKGFLSRGMLLFMSPSFLFSLFLPQHSLLLLILCLRFAHPMLHIYL